VTRASPQRRSPAKPRNFGARVVAWQREHGRHALPWQNTRDAYAIWVSEIMLQQTQVATVVPYYEKFMASFPTVRALADATLDDVLGHWSGLGYYSRARNLHGAAVVIRDVHGGRFPETMEEVEALPGIGRSTAAAIVVFAHGTRHAILDGNVKRLLARHCGVHGFPGETRVARELWSHAERLLPLLEVEAYTQGLMDLGATICARRNPRCGACPVSAGCVARREGLTGVLPSPRPRKPLPHRHTVMLVLARGGEVLLEKRPAPGIWGGLWSFPEAGASDDHALLCAQRYGAAVGAVEHLPHVEHGFTHFKLTISPQRLEVSAVEPRAAEGEWQWLSLERVKSAAIPAPVRFIVEQLERRVDAARPESPAQRQHRQDTT
jgi:A/G-specific adenine glycosylase